VIHNPILIASFLGFSLFAASQVPPKPATPKPAPDAQLYRNSTFGFRYEIPYGWVDRSKEMRAQQGEEKGGVKNAVGRASATNDVLLAVFERPPGAAGATVNSAVVIATEGISAYPGLKRAEDYYGPLTDLATAKGFKPAGDPSAIEIDGHQFFRADFVKSLNEKLAMHQSTLVLLAKSQIVSFTFISGDEDELDDLIDRLHFTTGR